MKNVQVIDEAINAAYTIFSVTEEEFGLIFPGEGQDIEVIEDMVERLGDDLVGKIMAPVWDREVAKRDVCGIHGTLFYGMPEKRKYYEEKREPVINWRYVK